MSFIGTLTPKCARCKKRYPIMMGEELPSMMGFRQKNGKTINLCRKCILDLGSMETEEERNRFFEEIGVERT